MKILFVTPFPPPMGGISNWSKLVYDYINENEKDIEVKYINIAPKKRATDGRTLFDRIFNGFLSIVSTKKELKSILKTFSPDVVHINTSGSLALFRDIKLLKILKKRNIKSVLHLRFGRVPEVLELKKGLEYKLLNKAFKLANVIMAIDKKTYNSVSQLYGEKVICIPNPFVSNHMPNYRLLTIANNNRKISFLGWVVKTKGVEELLVTWKNIYAKYPNWELDLIGPCDEKYMTYLKQTYSFDGVNIVGEKKHDEAMNMINNSDIFVLPTYTEGFPNVILEAMYLGKAIVSTNVGAIPEMLANGCGVVIEPKDSDTLTEKLEELINNRDLVMEYGKNANIKCNEYSIENVMKQYKNVWFK